ncbi:GNAT family N-acetyltransferase [Hyphobacterium sp. SN044]|uniref:GNAT family N-acetyltransferase n=1 Tax=Hyphobacterium sp. SN044 TaxID=2912575 RepID=UPI001F3CF585|nr:GNAT family N-acetyltransferase [Hyphobacterium sp. SN044]MCF8878636.1 GNAT family N-acetyltransferase [Hyphobacterium sp. SN044]
MMKERAEIALRELEDADVTERYLAWFRDPEVTKFLESRDLTRDDVLRFINDSRGKRRFIWAICDADTGLHIGNVKIDVNWKHSAGELSLVIGDKDYWGRGAATRTMQLATEKAFTELGIRKIRSGLYADNHGSRKMLERAGWRLDALQRDELLRDRTPVDRLIMCAFNPGEWRTQPPEGRA